MPMKTVNNRTNAPPLDHVGVINETAKLTCEGRHTRGTPALQSIGDIFVYLKLEVPPKNQLVEMKEIYT